MSVRGRTRSPETKSIPIARYSGRLLPRKEIEISALPERTGSMSAVTFPRVRFFKSASSIKMSSPEASVTPRARDALLPIFFAFTTNFTLGNERTTLAVPSCEPSSTTTISETRGCPSTIFSTSPILSASLYAQITQEIVLDMSTHYILRPDHLFLWLDSGLIYGREKACDFGTHFAKIIHGKYVITILDYN